MFAAQVPGYNPEFARAVAAGLTAKLKSIPACWLYDELGSALFEAITFLPEYGLTRADSELLRRWSDEVIQAAGNPPLIVELGSGTGAKTRHVLAAAAKTKLIRYVPIDISPSALRACEMSLSDMENVRVEGVAATYFEGLERALAERRSGDRALILFLGSTIGNFSPAERGSFLRRLRSAVQPGDSLLLGTDLVKPREILLRAYDDLLGVTAAFNLNVLVRINRELGGVFDIAEFAHEARYDEKHSRIEMHLRSRKAQAVRIRELDLRVVFAEGETIWTESCHKFTAERVRLGGTRAGWQTTAQWVDDQWGFAETLLSA